MTIFSEDLIDQIKELLERAILSMSSFNNKFMLPSAL